MVNPSIYYYRGIFYYNLRFFIIINYLYKIEDYETF